MSKQLSIKIVFLMILGIACTKNKFTSIPSNASAPDANTMVAKVNGQEYSLSDLSKKNPGDFYDIEKKKYELVRQAATTMFLENYWDEQAKKLGVSKEEAQKQVLEKNAKVSEAEFNQTYQQLKNHSSLRTRSEADKKREIRNYLKQQSQAVFMRGLVQKAEEDGKLVISYPKPQEPVYELAVRDDDRVRYGPSGGDIKPVSCKGDDCITIIEYSGYQCPACRQASRTSMQVMQEYKGKVRWIMRDFPLSFHKRSRPSARAAHCAADQDKYWFFYDKFLQTGQLEDADIMAVAKENKLDMKAFKGCYDSDKYADLVEKNLQSGLEFSVTGTPAFFINGRKIGGVNPFSRFKEIIDDELAKKKG